ATSPKTTSRSTVTTGPERAGAIALVPYKLLLTRPAVTRIYAAALNRLQLKVAYVRGWAVSVKLVLVAACALVDTDGRVLLAERPAGKPMAGLWEFPGGKIEGGERAGGKLVRGM